MNSRNLDEVVTKSRVSRVRWVGGRVCSDCHDGVLVNKNTNAVMNSVCMCVSLVMNTYRRRGVRVSDVSASQPSDNVRQTYVTLVTLRSPPVLHYVTVLFHCKSLRLMRVCASVTKCYTAFRQTARVDDVYTGWKPNSPTFIPVLLRVTIGLALPLQSVATVASTYLCTTIGKCVRACECARARWKW